MKKFLQARALELEPRLVPPLVLIPSIATDLPIPYPVWTISRLEILGIIEPRLVMLWAHVLRFRAWCLKRTKFNLHAVSFFRLGLRCRGLGFYLVGLGPRPVPALNESMVNRQKLTIPNDVRHRWFTVFTLHYDLKISIKKCKESLLHKKLRVD